MAMNAQKNRKSTKAGVLFTASSALAMALVLQGCGAKSSNDGSTTLNPVASTCQAAESDTASIFTEVEQDNSGESRVEERGQDNAQDHVRSRIEEVDQDQVSDTLRRRFVKVDMDRMKRLFRAGAGQKIKLPLFADREVTVAVENVEQISDDNAVVVGRLEGDALSAVTLVMNKGVLVGNINSGMTDEKYEIRYLSDGVHSIRAEGGDKGGDCLEVAAPQETVEEQVEAQAMQAATKAAEAQDESNNAVEAKPVIDMLVAYTPAARDKEGGTDAIRAEIQLSVANTTRAFADSGVNAEARLVGMMELKQNESSYNSDLTALKSKTDGKWDEVHAERARLGADQVTVIGAYANGGSVYGIGYTNSTAASAFTIVKSAAFGMYTVSHELGHNFGLQHSDGLQSSAGKFRTIIAYGQYPRIRRYSNPSLPYNGFATGDSSHNEASILNKNAAKMSNLVASKAPVATPAPAAPQPAGSVGSAGCMP
jgi:hypothetical protein